MTAPLTDKWTPSPERAFAIAAEGGLRLSEASKASALIFAAIEANEDFRFVAGENWIVIRRLMASTVRADDFGLLVAAVAAGDAPLIRATAERLVNGS